MKSAQTVYYGPAYSGYPSVGSVSANESVEYFWTEGAWCYICYSVSGTSNKLWLPWAMGLFSWSIKTALIRVDPNSMPRIAFPAWMVDFASDFILKPII